MHGIVLSLPLRLSLSSGLVDTGLADAGLADTAMAD